MMSKKIFLYASDIAAFLGQNKWNVITPFERLWKRCDTDYNNIIESVKNEISKSEIQIAKIELQKKSLDNQLQNKEITSRQYSVRTKKLNENKRFIQLKIEETSERLDDIVLDDKEKFKKILGEDTLKQTTNEVIRGTENDLQEKTKEIGEMIDKIDISDENKKKIKKISESFMNKTYGTHKEDSAIDIFKKKYDVELDTSQKFYSKSLIETLDGEWFVCGKIDGLYENTENPEKSYIVEVKNRTKCFFNRLRDYEKTQIQLYMWMSDLHLVKLVEKLGKEIRITAVYRDEEYIKKIERGLKFFITKFENDFVKDRNKKVEYVSYDDIKKQDFLKNMYLNDTYKIMNDISEESESEDSCNIMTDEENV